VGFQNGFGNLAGVVVPVVTGFLLGRTGSFFWALASTTAVALIGTASWLFVVGPVEQVDWGSRSLRLPLAPNIYAATPESTD
jgi:ACS family D-galactonate transporter-like MFS transporter